MQVFRQYQQKTESFPQKKTVFLYVCMIKYVYIKSYSKNLVLIFKYTSDFRQYLPREFQFDESNIKIGGRPMGVKINIYFSGYSTRK